MTLSTHTHIIDRRQEMYSTKDAAKKMGISEGHLRLLLETGKVEGKKLGRDWVVLDLNYKRKRRLKGDKK